METSRPTAARRRAARASACARGRARVPSRRRSLLPWRCVPRHLGPRGHRDRAGIPHSHIATVGARVPPGAVPRAVREAEYHAPPRPAHGRVSLRAPALPGGPRASRARASMRRRSSRRSASIRRSSSPRSIDSAKRPTTCRPLEPVNKDLCGLGYSARLRNYWDLSEAANRTSSSRSRDDRNASREPVTFERPVVSTRRSTEQRSAPTSPIAGDPCSRGSTSRSSCRAR